MLTRHLRARSSSRTARGEAGSPGRSAPPPRDVETPPALATSARCPHAASACSAFLGDHSPLLVVHGVRPSSAARGSARHHTTLTGSVGLSTQNQWLKAGWMQQSTRASERAAPQSAWLARTGVAGQSREVRLPLTWQALASRVARLLDRTGAMLHRRHPCTSRTSPGSAAPPQRAEQHGWSALRCPTARSRPGDLGPARQRHRRRASASTASSTRGTSSRRPRCRVSRSEPAPTHDSMARRSGGKTGPDP
jgi:hypothetical protein